MSSNKRRKVDGTETPRSAVSAIAARRRLAEAASPSPQPATTSEDEEPVAKTTNAYSALQALKGRAYNSNRIKEPVSSPGPSKSTENQWPEKKSSTLVPNSVIKTVYSSFKLNKQNSRKKSDGTLELRLDQGERFVALGSYGFQVSNGQVSIFGGNFATSAMVYWVQAASCHCVPVMRVLQKSHIVLHQDPNFPNFQNLGRISPLFGKIWHGTEEGTNTVAPTSSTFQILSTSDDVPARAEIQELTCPAEWNKKLALLADEILVAERANDTTLICGPKSSGKSTFSKLLTNRLLTSSSIPDQPKLSSRSISGVAVLDLDPGQPEYAPTGTLSLVHVTCPNLSPSFAHPGLESNQYRVTRCHTIASNSPASAPELYLDCASDLFDTYRRTLRNCPLVINTPGWILGTGLDLMTELISRVNPKEVVYLSEDGPLETVEALQSATKKIFSTLPSQPGELTLRSAAQFRAMQMMSYFHSADPDSRKVRGRMGWDTKAITSMPPWFVRYTGKEAGLLGIICYDYQVPLNLLADAINGMVLAVVQIEDDRAFRDSTRRSNVEVAQSPEGLPSIQNFTDMTLDPQYAKTVGFALIRGIDTDRKYLQLITPIQSRLMAGMKANGSNIVLVHGKFDTPTWAYTEDIYERSVDAGEQVPAPDSDGEDTNEQGLLQGGMGAGALDSDVAPVPWVEVLHGNQKRPVGSQVWRVRRDLGRNSGD